MATPPLNPLVEKIRAKYPGAYDDMDDAALTKAVLGKYPGYADLAAPSPLSSAAKPNVQMQTSGLGQAIYGPPSNADESGLRSAGYAGPAPSQINPYTSSAAMALGPAAIAGKAALGAAQPVARLAAKHPIISTMAISEARRIPYVGKYIPPYSELIPLFLGKGGGGAAAEGEAAAGEAAATKVPKTVEQPLEIKGTSATAANPSGFPKPASIPVQNTPYTPSGESAARQILGGFDNQTLIKIAKSRGVDIAAERQLKPTVGNGKIIEKVLDDMKPDELQEIRDRWIESTRQGLPQGIGPEAYQTAAQKTYFPDVKVSKAQVGRMGKAMANRQP